MEHCRKRFRLKMLEGIPFTCRAEIFWLMWRVRAEVGPLWGLSDIWKTSLSKNVFPTGLYWCLKSYYWRFIPSVSLVQTIHWILFMKQWLGSMPGKSWLFLRPPTKRKYLWAGDTLCYCQQLTLQWELAWQILFQLWQLLENNTPKGIRHTF